MYILGTIIKWGWSPVLITAIALAGFMQDWEFWVVGPALVVTLVLGMVVTVVGAREKQLQLSLQRLKQLAGYFTRRFSGNSSLSIFAIIDSLFGVENSKLWDWAQACNISQRIFNTWCGSFMDRIESDIKARSFGLYLRTYINELWLINSHYYEFIEQFYEVAAKVKIPPETIDQYNRFVMEYNVFAQDFRDNISELKKVARTEIEPPSVRLAKELTVEKSTSPP